MYETRNSKRVAGIKDKISVSKAPKVLVKEETKRKEITQGKKATKAVENSNKICKRVLRSKNDIENVEKQEEIHANKKSHKCELQPLKNNKNISTLKQPSAKLNDKKAISKELNNGKNLENRFNIKKDFNLIERNSKDTKNNSLEKANSVTSSKKCSENILCYAPVLAANKILSARKTNKRSRISEIYDIERDEDLMNESPRVKKKKKIIKKPKTIKSKINKYVSSNSNQKKTEFFALQNNEVIKQLKSKELTKNTIKDNAINNKLTMLDHVNKIENLNCISRDFDSILKPMDHISKLENPVLESVNPVLQPTNIASEESSPVLEPLNSILESSIVSEHVNSVPEPTNSFSNFVNSVPEPTNSFSNSVDCIADSLNCIVKPSCSIEPLSPIVHKDIEMLVASDTSVAQNRKTLDKIENVEDCFNELINSILDVDTFAIEKRAKEKLNKDNIKFKKRSLNDDDAISCLNENANFLKMSKKAQQFFIVPKMTSTPENGRPVTQSANQHQGVNGLKLSEMSSIPYTSSLNPPFEQSDYESSLLKLSTDVQIPLFQSPCKDNDETEIVQNVHPVDTNVSSALKEKTAVNQLDPSLKVKKLSKTTNIKLQDAKRNLNVVLSKDPSQKENISKPRQKRKCQTERKEQANPLDSETLSNSEDKVGEKVTSRCKKGKNCKTSNKDKHTECTDTNDSSGVTNEDFYEIVLFESPILKKPVKKIITSSPIKKVKRNVFAEIAAPSPVKKVKNNAKIQKLNPSPIKSIVSKPRKSYITSHARKCTSKIGPTPEENKAIEDKLIEEMNQHFSELENTVLCIE